MLAFLDRREEPVEPSSARVTTNRPCWDPELRSLRWNGKFQLTRLLGLVGQKCYAAFEVNGASSANLVGVVARPPSPWNSTSSSSSIGDSMLKLTDGMLGWWLVSLGVDKERSSILDLRRVVRAVRLRSSSAPSVDECHVTWVGCVRHKRKWV